MPCPTCDHTMHRVAIGADGVGRDVDWCPRCGTVAFGTHAHAPKLVERCRRYEAEEPTRVWWETLGIAEAIRPLAAKGA